MTVNRKIEGNEGPLELDSYRPGFTDTKMRLSIRVRYLISADFVGRRQSAGCSEGTASWLE